MNELLLRISQNIKDAFEYATGKQDELNKEVEDSIMETYETVETKTAEIEDAIIELYEMISE